MLFPGSVALACSATFLAQQRPPAKERMTLPTTDVAFLHQLAVKIVSHRHAQRPSDRGNSTIEILSSQIRLQPRPVGQSQLHVSPDNFSAFFRVQDAKKQCSVNSITSSNSDVKIQAECMYHVVVFLGTEPTKLQYHLKRCW